MSAVACSLWSQFELLRTLTVDGEGPQDDIVVEVGGRTLETRMESGAKAAGRRSGLKSLMWIVGVMATIAAAVLAAVLAIFFAATVVVIGLLSAVMISLGAMAYRARSAMRPRDPTLLEARHIGGHSWVAYGWDERGR